MSIGFNFNYYKNFIISKYIMKKERFYYSSILLLKIKHLLLLLKIKIQANEYTHHISIPC